MTDPRIILVNESTKRSVVTDTVAYGLLVGSFWLNHAFLGDGVILQLVLALCFIATVVERVQIASTKMTPDEALEYLQKRKSA